MSKFPMTVEGNARLQAELDQLIKVDRENIKKAIAEARALGDLKENAEYHAAKEKQGHIEGRIGELQNKLANAQIIDTKKLNGSKVLFGATVTIFDMQKDISITYKIVGEDEAAASKEKISYNSPLAKALIGKEVGEEVVVKAPKGDLQYEIEDVIFN
ncbi:MAG: transcription elongation factor GreA [Halobacteriovoraceae bacterium]|nr:transcription elongation factor GreA [Halobacteriovoraceae bacterium]